MIRKLLLMAFGLVVLMAAPAAAQYGPGTTSPTAPTSTTIPITTTTCPAARDSDCPTTTLPPTTETTPPTVVESSTTSSGELGLDTSQGGGTGVEPANTSALPRTGVDTTNMLRLAGVLLLAGGALTLAATKRRRHQAGQ